MADLPGGGFGFWLDARDYEPRNDPAWTFADPAFRTLFTAVVAEYAASMWQASRAAGLDRWGRSLIPIHPLTMKARKDDIDSVKARPPYSPMGRADPDLPPLTPTGARSRTRSLFRWAIRMSGVWFYWLYDPYTGHYWGEILARHARGFHQFFRYPKVGWGYVPPRDVMGFSDAERIAIRGYAMAWWSQRRLAIAQARVAFAPQPAPQQIDITMPPGAKVLPRSRRGPSPFAQPGQIKQGIIAERSAVSTRGGDLGPGTAGFQFRKKGKWRG